MDIVCNVQTEEEFLITTLEMFGLVEGYMECVGHWSTWEKDQEKINKNNKKKGGAKKPQAKTSFMDRQKALHQAEKYGVAKKPTHFDLQPIKEIMKKFIACSA
jgi:hypothetical protein